MGREFTNALLQTPLWQFALIVYPQNKRNLLRWQDQHSANVNDLIALAYAQSQKIGLPNQWWRRPTLQRIKDITNRIRQLRKKSHDDQHQRFLEFELMLEGLQIQLLQDMFHFDESANNQAINNILDYEKFIGTKKGALAPFIQTLIQDLKP